MLKLLDYNRAVMPPLNQYKNLMIERVLEYDDRTLSFNIMKSDMPDELKLENYIRTEEDEYVIKAIDSGDDDECMVTCRLNIDELEGTFFNKFESNEKTLQESMNLALAGTGWSCKCDLNKKRTLRLTNKYVWDIVKQAISTYRVDVIIDSIAKIITFVEKRGEDKGTYFIDQLNLSHVSKNSDTSRFFTTIFPVGKDGLTIEDVNNGSKYISNHTYSNKEKMFYWKDERYTDAASLKEDAAYKLRDLAHPYNAYSCDIIDLSKISKEYAILSYSIGDTVTLTSKRANICEKQRIVKICEYPDNPENNTCELSNLVMTFDEYTSKYDNAVATVDNITSSNGTIDGNAIAELDGIKVFVKVDTEKLNVSDMFISVNGKIGTLETTKLSATDAEIKYAKINDFDALAGRVGTLETTALTADSALIHNLTSDVSDINTMMFGSATGTTITTQFSNSVISVLGDATIKSAMIQSLSVEKILAGNISTNKFRVVSDSGNFLIYDNTLQISDGTHVRVQIGKDAADDYSLNLWNNNGQLIWSERGITENSIKSPILKDSMIAENAAIQASKLDITSLFKEINESSETIKSTHIYVDDEAQTLDSVFKTMTTYAGGGAEVWGSSIQQSQNFINNKLWWTDINAGGDSVSSKFASIDHSLDNISLNVSSLESQINGEITVYTVIIEPTIDNYPACNWCVPIYPDMNLYPDVNMRWTYSNNEYKKHLGSICYLDGSDRSWKWQKKTDGKYGWIEITNTETAYMLSRISSLEVNVGNIKTTVSDIQADLHNNYSTTSVTKSLIEQTSSSILTEVSGTYVTQSAHGTDVKGIKASLELKVDTKKLVSEINASADVISLKSNRFSLVSTYTNISSDGTINCSNLISNNAKITGGSININTNSQTDDRIHLSYKEWHCGISPLTVQMDNTSTGGRTVIQAGGYFLEKNNERLTTISDGNITTKGLISSDKYVSQGLDGYTGTLKDENGRLLAVCHGGLVTFAMFS